MDIELTSALDEGGFTWRAAGAKQPKGTVSIAVLPTGAKVGDEIKVEVEQTLDGLDILGVVLPRERQDNEALIKLKPIEREFKPVLETRAKGGRGGRDGGGGRGGRDSRGRRDGDRQGRRRDGGGRADGEGRGDRDSRRGGRDDGDRRGRGRGGSRFSPPPETPQRPKPKRLRPGKEHRNAVLAEIPEAQRPIAELALQGMKAVRQRLKEDNKKAVAAGQPAMPEDSVLQMAESMLPKLRLAEWRDRAEAAKRQLANLDLRDLRSVVAHAADPAVTRDESTRELAEELQNALATKQEEELVLWFGDVDAALAVGRVIRALRLSAQPPKAGVPFPVDIAERLLNSTIASMMPTDSAERWVATLEAAAFSPVHAQVKPVVKPDEITDELLATVKRLAPALPQVAELFEIEVPDDAPFPKPLRPDYSKRRKESKSKKEKTSDDKPNPKSEAKPKPEPKPELDRKPGAETKPEPETTEESVDSQSTDGI